MKFGKRLKHQIEQSLPEWRDKFLSYNDLKKVVKLISSAAPKIRSRSDEEFMHLLNNEIDKLNAFFMEQEEDFVIRHKELAQKIQNVMDKWGPNGTEQPSEEKFKEEMAKIRKQIVNFHGEMVLLVNYSNVNYTGLAKILKKYDKWTGGALRLPVIQKVVDQPFFTTDLISILVKECEMTMDSVFPPPEGAGNGGAAGAAAAEGIFRNTVAALLTMEEMRRSSSTHSHFSLPPLDLAGFDVIQSLRAHSPIPIP